VALLIVCLPSTSSAEGSETDFDRSTFYVRGGLATGFDAAIVLAEVGAGVGVGGAVGYRLHPRIAVEGQLQWLGNQSIGVFGQDFAQLSRWDATANGKLFLATGRVQPYAVIGAGYVRATGTCTASNCSGGGVGDSFVARFGAGLDVFITRNIGVYAEGAYMLAPNDIEPGESFPDYGTFGAGAIFAF